MNLETFLKNIMLLAKQNGISEPFITGGVPRDRVFSKLGEKSNIKDIDITTGNKDSYRLGKLLSKKYPDAFYKEYDDGHSSLDIYGIRLDFSSNFIIPNIDVELNKMGVTKINDITREMYSRDFTINTLLERLDFSTTFDITKRGIGDINAGFIRCPIDPKITIGIDARRILRAIKFAVKFDFTIEHKLKEAMIENRKFISNLPNKFVSTKIDEIIKIDADKGLDLLIQFNILPLAPLSKMVYDLLIMKRKLIKAL